jgi:hypothetical protein
MPQTFQLFHRSAAGTFQGTVTGEFVGKKEELARQRDAFVASLRASGWQVAGAGIQPHPEPGLEVSTPGPQTDGAVAPKARKRTGRR